MNWDLLKKWDIEVTDLDAIEDALEEKQIELEDRRDKAEANGNEARKTQLEEQLAEIASLMEMVTAEKEKAKSSDVKSSDEKVTVEPTHGVVPTAIESSSSRGVVPTVVDSSTTESKPKKASIFDNKIGSKADKADLIEKDHEKALMEKASSIRKTAEKAKADKSEAVAAAEAESIKAAEMAESSVKDEKSADTDDKAGKAKTKAELAAEKEAEKDVIVAGLETELETAIKLYMKEKYDDAFGKMLAIANKGDDAGLSKEKHGIAEFYSGMMYESGKGVKKDEDRALFWYRKGAGHRNVDACLAGARIVSNSVPSDTAEQYSKWSETLHLLQIAGEEGSKAARDNYVNICIDKFQWIGMGEKRKALRFLDQLITEEEDEYEKQQYRKKKWELSRKKHARNTVKVKFEFTDVITIIGAVLCALFALSHSLYWINAGTAMNVSDPTKQINVFLMGMNDLKIADFLYGIYPVYQMLPLFMLACVGWILTGLTSIAQRTKVTNAVCEVSMFFSVIVVFISDIISNQYWNSSNSLTPITIILTFAVCKVIGIVIRSIINYIWG